jgi:dipeptidyl aminopeptidase/acylaminoacyl peptidase
MRLLPIAILCALPLLPAEPAPSFTHDLLPIFDKNCSGCHAANVKMGSLDLDSYEAIRKGGNNGTIVVPGKSSASRLYLMVAHKAEPAMPLGAKPLAEADIETIRRWIDAGAPAPAVGEKASAPHAAAIPNVPPRKPVHAQIGALAYSPDGRLLALGTFQTVRLMDTASRQTVAEWRGHADQVRAVAFSPDGKLLAAAGGLPAQKGEVRIWDIASRAEVAAIGGHRDCIYAVAFAPDGKTIATSSYDKSIRLWDVSSGKEIRTLKDHIDAIYALAFTPDGKRLVSAAADRTVKVWNPATGERLYTMSEALDGLNTLAIHPTGRFVAAGGLDKTLRVWELGEKSATLRSTLIAHEDAILKLGYSRDGKVLISAAADRTLKAFAAADLTAIQDYPAQSDWVMSLDFSPDGLHFAVGRFDGSYEILDVPGSK